MIHPDFWKYWLVTAGVTYLVRALPMVFVRRKITNPFVLSFLHYLPYAVLSVMNVPAIFYATEEPIAGVVGFVVAVVMAWKGGSLIQVAAVSCLGVFLTELLGRFLLR